MYDTLTTSYSQAVNNSTGVVPRCWIYYGIAPSSGANTVSVSGSGGDRVLAILEYSGSTSASPLDSTNKGTATSNTPSAGSVLVNQANDLVVCFWSHAAMTRCRRSIE